VEAVSLDLDFAAIDATVSQTMQEAIEPLCEIVNRFGCDVLLLSGRGARWPAVSAQVIASLAIEPHRVQPMHQYRVGAWYPFADGTGRIFDPKTTVAVGAMLYRLLRGGQLDNFALTDKFTMRSTARYVGLMESDRRILADRVLFRDLSTAMPTDPDAMGETEESEQPLTFSGRSFLGFKQFAAERWPSSQLYRIEFASADSAAGVALPLTFTLRRKLTRDPDGDAMEFEIDENSVVDARGNPQRKGTLVRSLQTLPGDEGSHWLDAGQLATLDAILGAMADDEAN
jgi:hypothetical protein